MEICDTKSLGEERCGIRVWQKEDNGRQFISVDLFSLFTSTTAVFSSLVAMSLSTFLLGGSKGKAKAIDDDLFASTVSLVVLPTVCKIHVQLDR